MTLYCPRCGSIATITKRVCFGADPHNEYRCTDQKHTMCHWKGRSPAYVVKEETDDSL